VVIAENSEGITPVIVEKVLAESRESTIAAVFSF
jgi:hypothetical protein